MVWFNYGFFIWDSAASNHLDFDSYEAPNPEGYFLVIMQGTNNMLNNPGLTLKMIGVVFQLDGPVLSVK
jgi:hypothetical protein